MQKLILSLMFFAVSHFVFAQGDMKKSPMIEAEYGFIAMAKDRNTVDAFMTFLSDSAVTFSRSGPRTGKEHLKSQEPDEAWLSWSPGYTDMSSSGAWGFNIGPWDFRPKRTDENPVAFGHFITVWKKESDGVWRAALDIGVGHPKPEKEERLITTAIQSQQGNDKLSREAAFEVERKFISALKLNDHDAYAKAISIEAKIFRNGEFPIQTNEAILSYIEKQSSDPAYKISDVSISPSGDMFCVYGTAIIQSSENGTPTPQQVNYVRIWKKENGKAWKLVVDVLS